MSFSDKELEQFKSIVMQRKAKRDARKTETVNPRKDYSAEEYERRLKIDSERTQKLVMSTTQNRIDSALARWEEIVGPRFFGAGLEVNEPKIQRRIKEFTEGGSRFNSSIVLSGDLGVGKTWRAYGYAERLIRENVLQQANIIEGTEISVLGSIATSGFRKSDKMNELLDPRHKFFLIDEVGRTNFPNISAQHEVWYELVNHIYMNDLTLVISTNLSTNVVKKDKPNPLVAFRSISQRRDFLEEEERLEKNPELTTALEEHMGKAAYDRLKHIVGDGMITPEGGNRRPEVLQQKRQSKNGS